MTLLACFLATSVQADCPSFNDDPGLNPSARAAALDHQVRRYLAADPLLPGLAVAVVADGAVVLARGYGHRDLSACLPVTASTRFYLKSTTKSFLGLAVSLMHEEGLVELDAPITDYLPALVLPDGLNPSQVSLRDHLTHTQPYFDAGVNYRTAFPGNLPESAFVQHIQTFATSKDIRFRYSNFGPILAAHAVSVKTGEGWRDFIVQRVFEPAGMHDSFTRVQDAEKGEVAVSYVIDDQGRFEAVTTKSDEQMHAAGGVFSTVDDLARWVLINLQLGRIDGEVVFPQRALERAHARQVALDWDFLEFHRFAHGLGVYSADYDGDLLMHHFGGETHVSFMPERGLGVVVLSNNVLQGSSVTHRLAASLYDVLLDRPDVDERAGARMDALKAVRSQWAERYAQAADRLLQQVSDAPAQFEPSDLEGRYVDPRLGDMVIEASPQGLSLRFGVLTGALRPLGGDGFAADFGAWGQPAEFFQFRRDDQRRLLLDWGGRIFTRQ